jgi:hypothetical protein
MPAAKPSSTRAEDLTRRIDALEEALDQMHRAFKADVAALRAEIGQCADAPRLDASDALELLEASEPLPLVLMVSPPRISKAAPPVGIVSEIPPPKSVRDPRAEDD